MFGAANPLIGSASGYNQYTRHNTAYVGDAPDDTDSSIEYGYDYVGDAPDPAGGGYSGSIVGIVALSVAILVVAKGLGFRSMIAVNA